MDKALLEFAGRLRKSGLMVSPAEVLDAGRAAAVVGVADRGVFKAALRASLVKRGRDIPAFNAVFDLFFSRGPKEPEPKPGTESEPPSGPETPADENAAQLLRELLDVVQPDLSLTTQMILAGRFSQLFQVLASRSGGMGLERLENPLQVNFFQRRLRQEMDLGGVRAETDRFFQALKDRGIGEETLDTLEAVVETNLDRLDREMRRLIRRELEQNRYLFLKRLEEEDLTNKNLAQITEGEIARARPVVQRLAQRLKDRLSLRLKRAERGRFDLKNTLRRNVGLGGPLPYLEFRHRKPAKPQVVALCDVSNSVRNFSRFMLLFLYTLKEVISRVRSFIFIGDLAEVTGLFQRHEINEAVSLAAQGRGLTWIFRTDYGGAFSQFAQEFIDAVGPRTTVLILGDGRNNFFDPKPWALAEMAGRARKVIWLNPEPRPNWRIGDSAIEHYQPYCQMMAECGNLGQLAHILEENLAI
jgi:uncharacterized protein with von Willebrand factor type A (vWA) domain